MFDFAGPVPLIILLLLVAVTSYIVAPRRGTVDGFYGGSDELGRAPGLWTLVLSQVTTWIFARSLMNAAILGYYYGIAGTLAYTAYYGSFLTGMWIVGRLRAQGRRSLQDWLRDDYGRMGVTLYNIVISLRLMSEVFANLLVIGLIFAAAFDDAPYSGEAAMVLMALVGLGYSMLGGLRASLKTDVAQMLVFLAVFGLAFIVLIFQPDFDVTTVLTAPGVSGPNPGWILLAVAGLQLLSYPAHDPVMMDRGFLADEKVTRRSFLHAFWISALCIFGFGLFGVQAGVLSVEGDTMQGVWDRMFGPFILFCINASLLVSALSTLDSALSSAARLTVVEIGLGSRNLASGRIAMAAFMLGGVLFLLAGTEDLFAAVAVSGTASMFLAPVLIFGLGFGRAVPAWSFLTAFMAAMAGAIAYFFQSSDLVIALSGEGHKYERLLWICVAVLVTGFSACGIGAAMRGRVEGVGAR